MLPSLPEVGPPRPWRALQPGVYAVSATMLSQVYSRFHDHWDTSFEREYQTLRPLEPNFIAYANEPGKRAELERLASPAEWRQSWKRYELLRFARLCYYLRVRPCDASIGYSILVFRLSPAEFDAALNGPASELAAAIERAMARPRP